MMFIEMLVVVYLYGYLLASAWAHTPEGNVIIANLAVTEIPLHCQSITMSRSETWIV